MTEEMPFSSEEIKKLRELLEIEAIRKVRLLYSQLLDSGEIDALVALFTEGPPLRPPRAYSTRSDPSHCHPD